MDETIKMILGSYEGGLQNYRKSLGEDNPVLVNATACYEKLMTVGESSKDMMEFSGKTTTLLPEMSQLFMALSNEKPVHKVVQEVPAAAKIAAGYHISYNSISDKEKKPETCKVYERIFELEKQAENGIQFMRMINEEGLLVKMTSYGMMETSESLLDGELKNLSLYQMKLYHENMIREMKEASSAAEIDYYSNTRSDISYYENQWDTMYLIIIYVNLGNAITSYILAATEENRQAVEYSYRFVAKYFGITYDEIMALPRIRDYFDKMIWVTIREKFSAGGIDTPEKYFSFERQYLEFCIKDKAPVEFGIESKKILTFFGKQYHIHNDMPGLFAKVPHPDDKNN
jgi:hypothetical protein